MTAFELTILAKKGLLTKRIEIAPNGAIHSDSSDCFISKGTARRFRFKDVQQFAQVVGRLGSHEALTLGRLCSDCDAQVPVVTQDKLAQHPGAIARTQKFIAYEKGQPALALIDFDQKGIPREVADKLEEFGGLWPALTAVVPELMNAARVLRRSTSAGLHRTDTGEPIAGSGGIHAYIAVRDGTDIERFLHDLHKRC